MHKSWLVLATLMGAGLLVACDNQGTIALPYQDGGPEAAPVVDGSVSGEAGNDSAPPGDGGGNAGEAEAGPPPPSRLLLTYNGNSSSELVAFGLTSKAVDGRMTYGDPLGAAFVGSTAPWLLEQSTDVVARLDAQQPWVKDSSWNVALTDLTDAGYAQSYADPQAVLVSTATKAYVLRYTRNLIAIIDPATVADGGAPTGTIDLSSELQTGGDGYVQPVAGVYVAAQQRVYVVLGNINRNDVVDDGYNLLCAATTPTVIAIDTTSDTLVDLNGAAPGHGWPMVGYDPILGPGAVAFDALTGSSGRLLILEAGCNDTTADGGAGALVKREIESVDLAAGTAEELLDLTGQGFPSSLTYVDAHDAIVQLDTAYKWDPTTKTLGTAIPNASTLSAAVYDGAGNLLGLAPIAADSGPPGYDVVSLSIASGTVTTLGTASFTLTSGFIGGVALWPSP